MKNTVLLGLIVSALSGTVAAQRLADTAKERRQALDRLERGLIHEVLQARIDIRNAGPAPRMGRATELRDGSYYVLADSGLGFEELGAVRVVRTSLRDKGRILLVTLAPPSYIVPRYMHGAGRELDTTVLVEADVDEAGSVREALASIVYLPGETPDDDAVARCIARYPDQDARRARLRCGLEPE